MISFLTACVMVIFWVVLTHIALTSPNHPVFRLLLVISAGAVFWTVNAARPEGISQNLMWVAPTIGLIANLWARAVKLDGRTVASAAIGLVVTALLVWAILPAYAENNNNQDALPDLPAIEKVVRPPSGVPPISADFLRQIRAENR